jgi:uncharacterized membrane protein YdjX (TVP38/TMEM64 family)
MTFLVEIDNYINELILNSGYLAPFIASLLILMEPFFPILPFVVFLTINILFFGYVWGFTISYILTCLASYLFFRLFRYRFKKTFDKKFMKKHHARIKKGMNVVSDIKLEGLVILIAIPFTPTFFVNIIAGLSSISEKRYIMGLLLGKIFSVYFWAFVGKSVLESLTNPYNLLVLGAMVMLAFIISKLIGKTYRI